MCQVRINVALADVPGASLILRVSEPMSLSPKGLEAGASSFAGAVGPAKNRPNSEPSRTSA
jgi:hypothetical protein